MFFNLHLFPLDSHLLIVSVLSLNPMSKRKGLWNITETFHSVAICFLKQLLKINPKLLNFISDLHLSKISIPSLWGFRQKKKKTQNLKPLWKKCSLTPFQNVLKFKQTDKTNPRLGLFTGQIHNHTHPVICFFQPDSPLKPSFSRQVLRTRNSKNTVTNRTLRWMPFKKINPGLTIYYW